MQRSSQTKLGATSDTSATESVFGSLTKIENFVDTLETSVGGTTDTSTVSTIFGQLSRLQDIKTNVDKAKSSASSALSEAQAVRAELGAKGKTANAYDTLQKLENSLKELHTATETISESQVESGKLAAEILDTLGNVVNESVKAAGLGEDENLMVSPLSDQEISDEGKIHEKLDEINAKLNALKESVESDEVVVKSWFENSE